MNLSSSTCFKATPTRTTGRSARNTSIGNSTPTTPAAISSSKLAQTLILQALADLAAGSPAEQLAAARWLRSREAKTIAYQAGCKTDQLFDVARQIWACKPAERMTVLRIYRAQAKAAR